MKLDTLEAAYLEAKRNNGAPGSDGETFEQIETSGRGAFLGKLSAELRAGTYRPRPYRRREIPKEGGKVRVISIPAIRDRVIQGALRLILEPFFEADFSDSSFGARPRRSAHQAIEKVRTGLRGRRHRVVDLDLSRYFDSIRHDRMLAKVARRISDGRVTLYMARYAVLSQVLSSIYNRPNAGRADGHRVAQLPRHLRSDPMRQRTHTLDEPATQGDTGARARGRPRLGHRPHLPPISDSSAGSGVDRGTECQVLIKRAAGLHRLSLLLDSRKPLHIWQLRGTSAAIASSPLTPGNVVRGHVVGGHSETTGNKGDYGLQRKGDPPPMCRCETARVHRD